MALMSMLLSHRALSRLDFSLSYLNTIAIGNKASLRKAALFLAIQRYQEICTSPGCMITPCQPSLIPALSQDHPPIT